MNLPSPNCIITGKTFFFSNTTHWENIIFDKKKATQSASTRSQEFLKTSLLITTSGLRTTLKISAEIMSHQKKGHANESIIKPDTTTEQGDGIPFLGYLVLHFVVDFLASHCSASRRPTP
jgi:hypothetical protein